MFLFSAWFCPCNFVDLAALASRRDSARSLAHSAKRVRTGAGSAIEDGASLAGLIILLQRSGRQKFGPATLLEIETELEMEN